MLLANLVVLNLGSIEPIEPQGFGESLSGVRQGSRHRQYNPVHTSNVGPFLLVVDILATHTFLHRERYGVNRRELKE